MKKRLIAIIAIIAVLGTAVSVYAAGTGTGSASTDYTNLIDNVRWETTSIGANW